MPDDATPALPEVYEVAPRPPTPRLPGTVVVREDVDALVDAVAADLLIQAHNCVRTFGDFHLALSGGTTPVLLYQRLMIDPAYRELPWTRTHLWIEALQLQIFCGAEMFDIGCQQRKTVLQCGGGDQRVTHPEPVRQSPGFH